MAEAELLLELARVLLGAGLCGSRAAEDGRTGEGVAGEACPGAGIGDGRALDEKARSACSHTAIWAHRAPSVINLY